MTHAMVNDRLKFENEILAIIEDKGPFLVGHPPPAIQLREQLTLGATGKLFQKTFKRQ